MGQNLVQYEVSMEQLVVQELDNILKTDLPTIQKERKQLDQLVLDTANARLHAARHEDRLVETGSQVLSRLWFSCTPTCSETGAETVQTDHRAHTACRPAQTQQLLSSLLTESCRLVHPPPVRFWLTI